MKLSNIHIYFVCISISMIVTLVVFPSPTVHVYTDPYMGIDWQSTQRLKTQFHDHLKNYSQRFLAYDAAGYDAVPLLHYSGNASIDSAWTEKHWPPEDWLIPTINISILQNISIIFQSVEEIATYHITSPFLTEYIESGVDYESQQEAINAINERGGLAFLAHPRGKPNKYLTSTGYHAQEIFSAFFRAKYEEGSFATDLNDRMLDLWHEMLI
ncbi:MAG: hypothetical protein O7D86_12400 [Proteobacteria bacterium]|nr:hypothetical protein [Pseudomonadota bacterium]